jgi:uncharacterized membrane protein
VIVRLLVLVLAAIVAVVFVKFVFVVALVAIGICAALYAYRFLHALVPAVARRGRSARRSHARPHGVSPLVQPRISVRR